MRTSSSGPIATAGGIIAGTAAGVALTEASYPAATVIAGSLAVMIGVEHLLDIFDEMFETQGDYFTSEEYLLRLRESKWEGEEYMNRLINETRQLTERIDKLNKKYGVHTPCP